MTIYTCDRCNRWFSKKLETIKTTLNGVSSYYDICENCYFLFEQFMTCSNKQKIECRVFITDEKELAE